MEKETGIHVQRTARPVAQRFLRGVAGGQDEILQLYADKDQIIVQSTRYEQLHVGHVTAREAEWLAGLHSTPVTPEVVGGGYVLLDEQDKVVTHFAHHRDLSEEHALALVQGKWRAIQKHFGLRLRID